MQTFQSDFLYKQELSLVTFKKIAELIDRSLGIKMGENKRVMIEARLSKRLKALNLSDYESYFRFLSSCKPGDEEMQVFMDTVTTNKTDFFREKDHFEFLEAVVLPKFIQKGGKTLSVWSAGCSSGQEPYTLGMVLNQFKEKNKGFDYSILATDISSKVLSQAKEGIYSQETLADMEPALKSRYFELYQDLKGKEMCRIRKNLFSKIEFSSFNLISTLFGTIPLMDVIFCRNVLIYFERDRQEQIIRNLVSRLKPDGYLFLGHSESMAGVNLRLSSVSPAVYQVKEAVLS